MVRLETNPNGKLRDKKMEELQTIKRKPHTVMYVAAMAVGLIGQFVVAILPLVIVLVSGRKQYLELLMMLSWVIFAIIIYGILGFLFGRTYPYQSWKWGLLLSVSTICTSIYIVNFSDYYQDPNVKLTLWSLTSPFVVIFSACTGALLGVQFSPHKDS